MLRHSVDEIGLPLDPVLRNLEFHLGDLAACWRGNQGDPVRQSEIVKEYHATLARLYSLGWDAELDFDAELPDNLMPEEYKRRTQILAKEDHLCYLASRWRESRGNPEREKEAVEAYHAKMAELFSLGWERNLGADCELPEQLMPQEYLQRKRRHLESR